MFCSLIRLVSFFILILLVTNNLLAQCLPGTTLTGNADNFQFYNNVINAVNSTNGPDGLFTGNIVGTSSLVLDLTDVVPPGQSVDLYLRKLVANGEAIVESSTDGFNFFDAVDVGATFAANTPTTIVFNVTVPTRYIRFSIKIGSMQVDAISYDFCPDSDFDGTTDSDEMANGTDPNDACDPFYVPAFYLDCDGDGVNNISENSTNGQDPCVPSNTVTACDADGDTVSDADDLCPNTPIGTIVNSIGCPTTSVCEYTPPTTSVFTPSLVWHGINVDGRETPLVGDVTGDGITDVVVDNYSGIIYVLNGQNGATQHTINVGPMGQNNSCNAIGDVDGDGFGEIFTLLANRVWVRLDFDGVTWTQQQAGVGAALAGNNKYTPGLADFDGDGNVELFAGAQIWRTAFNGTPADLIATGGPVYADLGGAVAIDMLPDAACADCQGLELVMSGRVFSVNIATATITLQRTAPVPVAALAMRATSVADMDGDGDYDIVFPYVAAGQARVIVWDGQTNTTLLNYQLNTIYPRAGRINIADFDGDGELEMGVHFSGQGPVNQGFAPGQYGILDDINNSPAGAMLWVIGTNDYSGITGSTVFDFDGDGIYEVVYRDQTSLRILNGRDGFVKYMTPCTSGTRWEYPVVADVNDDGETNLICTCRDVGLSAFASANDPWIPSRGVWNQHGYNVTNINDDLTIPAVPNSNITTSNGLLNNFLVQSPRLDSSGQVEDLGTTDGDITNIQFGPNFDCSTGSFEYEMTVVNLGDKDLPSGFWFTVYDGDPEAGPVNVLVSDSIGLDVLPLDSVVIRFTLNACPVGALFAVLNDPGTFTTPYDIAVDFPLTNEDECDYMNNTHVLECRNPPPQNNSYGPYCQGSSLPTTVTTVLAVSGHNLNWYDNDPTTTGLLIGTGATINPALFANINVPGVYTAYVTEFDPNNPTLCESVAATVTVNIAANPVPSAIITQAIDCKDNCNGIISIGVTAGTPPYTYTWSGPTTVGNTPTGNNLCDGTYNITVTDDNGCVGTTSIFLSEPALLPATTSLISNVSCNGLSDGAGSVIATGGTTPYTYNWDSGHNGQTATNLDAGTHTVTVTDAQGCIATASILITEPPILSVSVVQDIPVGCNGESNGSASATPTGGTVPYVYTWDNNESTPTATGLDAGTHTITITDNNGCQTVGTILITEPPALTVTTVQVQPVSCNGLSDGQATATIGGGVLPYLIVWDNGETTTNATNLDAGVHTITVSDANGCVATSSVTITENSTIGISAVQVTAVLCNGESNGSATATGTGGLPPYTYSWDNTETTATATALNAGTHSVTVTDVNGCQAITTVVISEPDLLSGQTVQNQPVSCNGLSDGVATASATGGVLPYSYSWDSGITIATASNLNAGVHTVTITDTNNCTEIETVIITEPNLLSTSVVQNTAVICNGESNGTATATSTGGILPYSYNWDSGHNGQTATNLNAGTHSVTVTDNNGCQTVNTIVISEPTLLSVSAVEDTPVSCNGLSDGQSTATISGGITPYIIIWDNNETTTTATALDAGVHTITVTDANGCTAITTVTITENPSIIAAAIQDAPVVCFGESNGVATVTGSGGLPPYNYQWDSGQNTPTATNLDAGIHSVTVTDVNGCQTIATVNITQPTELNGQALQLQGVSCNGLSDGSANITAVGGIPPYTYQWDSGQNTQTATNLDGGIHSATITDQNNCIKVVSLSIFEPAALVLNCSEQAPVSAPNQTDGVGLVDISGGTSVYNINWDNGVITGSQATSIAGPTLINNLAPGNYNVTVTDGNGCSETCSFSITDVPCTAAISAIQQTGTIDCHGSCTGSIDLSITSMAVPITYTWSGPVTIGNIEDPTGLCAGTYFVVVTDGNGCQATTSINLSQPLQLSLVCAEDSGISAPNQTDGVGSVDITGGVSPYSIDWDNGTTTGTQLGVAGVNLISNLAPGNYSITVTDSNGCIEICAFSITDLPCLASVFAMQSDTSSCFGDCTGSILLMVNNAATPITYQWNGPTPIGNTPTANNLCVGTYYVTMIDANGCADFDSLTIVEPAELTLICSEDTGISAPNQMDAIGSLNINGGTPPFLVNWSGAGNSGNYTSNTNGQTFINNLGAGAYNITVTDANGCIEICSFTINNIPCTSNVTAAQTANILCNGDCTGAIALSLSGMTTPITYTWTGPTVIGNIQNPVNLCAGTYSVNAIDANGCTASVSITISEPPLLALSCSQISGTSAPNQNDGVGGVTITGGSSPFSIYWTSGTYSGSAVTTNNGNYQITGLPSGSYNVTVTDVNFCTSICSFNITDVPCTATASISQTSTIDCYGECTGALNVATGGNATGPFTYSWAGPTTIGNTASPANLCVGTYFVNVIDANGCIASASFSINEPDLLVLSCQLDSAISAPNQVDAVGGVEIFGGTAPFTLDWDNGIVNGTLTAPTNGNTQISGLGAGTYNVTVTDQNGCTENCSFVVPEVVCMAAISESILPISCYNECTGAIFLILTNTTEPVTFDWAGPTTIGNEQFPDNLCNGNYSVTITDANGCVATKAFLLENPDAVEFSVGDNVYLEQDQTTIIQATTNVPSNEIYDFYWHNTEHISCFDCFDPEISPYETTDYSATLIDGNGCTYRDTMTAFVNSGIFIPNIFTPNFDGINDVLYIYSRDDLEIVEFSIYSRWGELVHTQKGGMTNDASLGWNGIFRGKNANLGTYTYFARITVDSRDERIFTGDITLIR